MLRLLVSLKMVLSCYIMVTQVTGIQYTFFLSYTLFLIILTIQNIWESISTVWFNLDSVDQLSSSYLKRDFVRPSVCPDEWPGCTSVPINSRRDPFTVVGKKNDVQLLKFELALRSKQRPTSNSSHWLSLHA